MVKLRSHEVSRRVKPPLALSETSEEPDHSDGGYWRDPRVSTLPRTHLIPDFIRGKSEAGSYADIPFRLSKDLSRKVRKHADGDGTRSFSVLAAAAVLLLHRHDGRGSLSAEERFCLAAPPLTAPRDTMRATRNVNFVIPVAGKATLAVLLAQVSNSIAEAYHSNAATLRGRVKDPRHEREEPSLPLTDAFVALDDIHGSKTPLPADTDLTLDIHSCRNHFEGRFLYRADVFSNRRIRQFVVHYKRALRSILSESETRVCEASLLSPSERRTLLRRSRGEIRPYPVEKTVHGLFEEQTCRAPDRIAVKDKSGYLTYRELNELANRIANLLIELGAQPGEFVAILHERGRIDLALKLAALKTGTAFVPIDPSYPPDRVSYMLQNCEARFLLTQGEILVRYRKSISACAQLDAVILSDRDPQNEEDTGTFALTTYDFAQIAVRAAINPTVEVTGRGLCYMIYTSGSTGQPKGAMVRHDGAINHIFAEFDLLSFSPEDSLLQSAPASSDISIWQYLGPILIGGRVFVVDTTVLFDAKALFDLIKDARVALVEFVPVVLRSITSYAAGLTPSQRRLPDLKWMMVTGEAAPLDLINGWLSLYPGIKVINAYGPSEASDDVAQMVVSRPLYSHQRSVPIGSPLPNCRVYIVDRQMQLVPPGAPGEICVAGICVGNGYWRNEEKTAASFLPDPFLPGNTCDLYRTGDLGRWLADGTIEFLGRIDHQVNIRGFRIELEEVETVLRNHPAIHDVATRIWVDPEGSERMVAYIVIKQDKPPVVGEIRSFMSKALPVHMIPAIFIRLDRLPLAPSGKVDRRALPAPGEHNTIDLSSTNAQPTTAAEETLAGIWASVLRVKRIGIEDNFFELGGDSILGIQVANRARAAGLQLQPGQIFSHPTVKQQALLAGTKEAAATSQKPGAGLATDKRQPNVLKGGEPLCHPRSGWQDGALTRDSRDALEKRFHSVADVYPLGPAQEGIYIQCLLGGASGAYIEQTSMDLTGYLDQGALLRAWHAVTKKHPALRTGFARRRLPRPMQVVVSEVETALHSHDWHHIAPEHHAERWQQLLQEDRANLFSLEKPPLHRLTLIRLSESRHRLLLTYHHLLMDGWSEPVVLRDLLLFYRDIRAGSLTDPPIDNSYPTYLDWISQQDESSATHFWRSKLKGLVSPTPLAIEYDRPLATPKRFSWQSVYLTTGDTQTLQSFARKNRLTLSSFLQAGWILTLGHYSHATDVVYGTTVSGRQAPVTNIETMVGLAVNTLPVRVRIDLTEPLAAFLNRVQGELFEIQTFDYCALGRVQNLSDVPREKQPLIHSLFSLANYPDTTAFGEQLEDPKVNDVQLITVPDFPLTCFVVPDRRLLLRLVYDERLFEKGNINDALLVYAEVLEGLFATPKGTVGCLIERIARSRKPARIPSCLKPMTFEVSA
jgi:amino acid adenylation domain-containing protein